MKTHEVLAALLHEVRYQSNAAGRSEHGRALNILATELERAELWARDKTPESESHLVNPNQAGPAPG